MLNAGMLNAGIYRISNAEHLQAGATRPSHSDIPHSGIQH
jgi:hypothetical protein